MAHATEDAALRLTGAGLVRLPPLFFSHSCLLTAPGPFPDSAESLSRYLNESGFAHVADWLDLPQLNHIFWAAADTIEDNVSFASLFDDDENVLGRYYLLRPKRQSSNCARFVIIGQEPIWHGYLLEHLKTVGYDVYIDKKARTWSCTLDQTVIIPHVRDPYAHISATHHILKMTIHELFQVFQKEVRSMFQRFIQPPSLQEIRRGSRIWAAGIEASQIDKVKRKLFGSQ